MRAELIIAARGGPNAKSRLASRLTGLQREALVEAMLGDMLVSLAGSAVIRNIHVVTPTPALARLAARHGAAVLLDGADDDLNGAFDRARRRIAAADPEATALLLPGDLPRLQAAELEGCLAATDRGSLVLAPASTDGGTGALAFRADVPLQLAFGAGSFDKHLAAARILALEARVFRSPGIGLDIDRPCDLDTFLASGGGGRTGALMQGWRAAA